MVLSIFGIAALIAIAILIHIIFFKKNSSDDESGDIESVFIKANVNLKQPIQNMLCIPDDFFSLFIAGVYTAARLSRDDLKTIFELKEDNTENKKKTKNTIKEIEKVQQSLDSLFNLKEEEEIKKLFSKVGQFRAICEIIDDKKIIDVSKKDKEPFKTIIQRIKNDNKKVKELLTRHISDKKKFNIVEATVCSAAELFKD